MHRAATFVRANPKVTTDSIGYYDTAIVDRRWVIIRRSSGHVFCICRSQEEAERLATMLNQ
jgi:hypothetical protein